MIQFWKTLMEIGGELVTDCIDPTRWVVFALSICDSRQDTIKLGTGSFVLLLDTIDNYTIAVIVIVIIINTTVLIVIGNVAETEGFHVQYVFNDGTIVVVNIVRSVIITNGYRLFMLGMSIFVIRFVNKKSHKYTKTAVMTLSIPLSSVSLARLAARRAQKSSRSCLNSRGHSFL